MCWRELTALSPTRSETSANVFYVKLRQFPEKIDAFIGKRFFADQPGVIRSTTENWPASAKDPDIDK